MVPHVLVSIASDGLQLPIVLFISPRPCGGHCTEPGQHHGPVRPEMILGHHVNLGKLRLPVVVQEPVDTFLGE